MNEEKILNLFDFLINEYKMKYIYKEFDNYLNTNATLITFTFYNDNGCFLIHNVPVKGEVEFIYLENINQLNQYGSNPSSVKKQNIDITSVHREIWDKYEKIGPFKNPLFWIRSNKVLKVLAEVVKKQIEFTGNFYGLEV